MLSASASCFNLDQSKILLSGNGLNLNSTCMFKRKSFEIVRDPAESANETSKS